MAQDREDAIRTIQSQVSNFQPRLFNSALAGKTSTETKALMKSLLLDMAARVEDL